jgi:hypothetical protein
VSDWKIVGSSVVAVVRRSSCGIGSGIGSGGREAGEELDPGSWGS